MISEELATGTSDPQYVTTERNGSRPPDVTLVHPAILIYPGYSDLVPLLHDHQMMIETFNLIDPQLLANQARLLLNTQIYTLGSEDMVWAWADDRDGDLDGLHLCNGANAVVQIRENPQPGDTITERWYKPNYYCF